MSDGILTCPFCGSGNISHGEILTEASNGKRFTQSTCLNCAAIGPASEQLNGPDYGSQKAIAAWNRRATPCPHIATSREGTSYCRLAESSVPEGCTSYDAQMLRRANHGLIDENAKLREALQFYAGGQHFIRDAISWDTVSGEPENFWCDESGTATVEDGYVAKMTLAQADALTQPEKSP